MSLPYNIRQRITAIRVECQRLRKNFPVGSVYKDDNGYWQVDSINMNEHVLEYNGGEIRVRGGGLNSKQISMFEYFIGFLKGNRANV